MFNDIFDPETVKDKKEYVKVKAQQINSNKMKEDRECEEFSESQIVFGEPIYVDQYNSIWNKDL